MGVYLPLSTKKVYAKFAETAILKLSSFIYFRQKKAEYYDRTIQRTEAQENKNRADP
jgi:hypothetical protein